MTFSLDGFRCAFDRAFIVQVDPNWANDVVTVTREHSCQSVWLTTSGKDYRSSGSPCELFAQCKADASGGPLNQYRHARASARVLRSALRLAFCALQMAAATASNSSCLSDEWVLWESVTDGGTPPAFVGRLQAVASMSTAIELWHVWHSYPLPSMLFTDGPTRGVVERSDGTKVQVTVLALFRKGIEPDWSSEHNRHGGQLRFRGALGAKFLDSVWQASVLAAVGEALELGTDASAELKLRKSPQIAGVRIVDRCTTGIRRFAVEVWLTTGPSGDQVGEKTMAAAAAATDLTKLEADGTLGRVGGIAARWRAVLERGLSSGSVTTNAGKHAFIPPLLYRPHASSLARSAVMDGTGEALQAQRVTASVDDGHPNAKRSRGTAIGDATAPQAAP